MTREIGLKSNFEDYYDELLLGVENPNFLFYRKRGILDKRLTLEYLNSEFGYFIPNIFKIKELKSENFSDNVDIVVFNKNQQEIKPWKTAVKRDSEKYGRLILKGKSAKSFIKYRVGSIEINSVRHSDHEYRSDLINSREDLVNVKKDIPMDKNRCIFSIEFLDINGALIAINFEEAPKLENTIVKEVLGQEEIYSELINWFRRKHG
jgi:hypothetical protein